MKTLTCSNIYAPKSLSDFQVILFGWLSYIIESGEIRVKNLIYASTHPLLYFFK